MEDGQLKSVGRHLILEMWGCRNLNSTEIVERALRDVVREADLTLLDINVYPFTPIGVTGIAVVTESHVMIHTWPEYGYAAVDVFTCGDQANPEAALPLLREHFAPERIQIMEINRGIMPQEPVATPVPICGEMLADDALLKPAKPSVSDCEIEGSRPM